jgi:hypothetical protein
VDRHLHFSGTPAHCRPHNRFNPSWEAVSPSVTPFMEPVGSLPCSQQPTTGPYLWARIQSTHTHTHTHILYPY